MHVGKDRNEYAKKKIELGGNMHSFFFDYLPVCSYFFNSLNLLLYTVKIIMSQSIKPVNLVWFYVF